MINSFSFCILQILKMNKASAQGKKDPYQGLNNIAFFCRVMGWIFAISSIIEVVMGTYISIFYIPSSNISIELRGELVRTIGFGIIVGVFATIAWFGMGGILRLLIDLKNDVNKFVKYTLKSETTELP